MNVWIRTVGLTAVALVTLALSACAPSEIAADAAPVVETRSGTVRGEVMQGYQQFLGIPYAAPPVGDLRWRAPRPVEPWSGVRDATRPSPSCPQTGIPGTTVTAGPTSEDCLYLNVTIPASRRFDGPLPVMVWIHGGGFASGAGADYQPGRLVRTGEVMVVTVNYRLGAFGFFGYPGLADSGTFGLQDQQQALRWVRENAAAFGGDPNNITVFGQSAGAMSVCAHLTNRASASLFDKAILQSGTCDASWPSNMVWPTMGPFRQFASMAEVEALGRSVAEQLGCTEPGALDCLRALAPERFLEVWPVSRPAYGNAFLPKDPAFALRAGEAASVPIIWGAARDEWRSSAGSFEAAEGFTREKYERFLEQAFGARAADVLAAYPPEQYEGVAYAWAAASTDSAWSCPTLAAAEQASARAPVYAFEFADRDAPNPAYKIPDGFDLGAAHATDLLYLFDLGPTRVSFTPPQHALSELMIRYWTTFARTGDPNHPSAPAWPRFDAAKDGTFLELVPDPGPRPVDFAARHHCDLWQSIIQREEA